MTTIKKKEGRGGVALIVALSFLMVMVGVAAGVLAFGQQQMHAARRTRDFLKSKVIAESGLNIAFNDIRNNIASVATYVGTDTAFHDGTYAIMIEEVGEADDDNIRYLRITSIGRCGIAEATETLAVRHRHLVDETPNPDLDAVLRNAVTSGGAITLGGSMYVGGDAATPVSIRINGNAGTITGSVYSPSFRGKTDLVGGDIADDPSRYEVDWDKVLDIDQFLGHAVTYDGRAWSSYPANTIVYCPGNVTIAANGTFQCCVIAEGDIHMSGTPTLLQPGTYPALVSLTGDIKLSGTAAANGLVAALAGTVTNSGNGDIFGCVISVGSFKESGNWSIFFTDVVIQPPGTVVTDDLVEVVAWQ